MSQVTYTANDPDSTCCAVLQRAYQAFNARNIEDALTCMDPDVDWPNSMDGGYLYGHKAVHDNWVRQWNMIDPQMEPVSFTSSPDGDIIVEVHQVVRDLEGNIILDETTLHVYLVLQGVIKRMEIRKRPAKTVTPAETVEEEAEHDLLERLAPAGGDRMAAMAIADEAAAVNATVARNAAASVAGPAGMESRVEPAA